ncbi:MAG: serine protease, partial [Verrucomicrobiota bacterium]
MAAGAPGATPVLDHLFPAAVRPGTTNILTAVGKFDPWPPQVWTETAGLTFRPTTNSGVFEVEVAPDTPAGAYFVRAHHAEGASAPRFLIVHDPPQTAEAEPNDAFARAQPVTSLPAHLNGRLEKTGDVDCYAVQLAAGQTLVARIESYVLMSPLDAALRVVDARGIQRAFNHDDGRTLDPRLVGTAPG